MHLQSRILKKDSHKMKKILFVCLGNICRSAAAEAVMKAVVEKAGRKDDFFIDSAGIISVHKGEPADNRMRKHAAKRGYAVTSISRPVNYRDFEEFDILVGMDNTNIDDLMDKAPSIEAQKKIVKMTDFCEHSQYDYVPDPYYGGEDGFELVLDILEDACAGLLKKVDQL